MEEKKDIKIKNKKATSDWGLIDSHPFALGFGLVIIITMITNSGFLEDNYIFVTIRAAISWAGIFFIVRGIYLAIKKRKK